MQIDLIETFLDLCETKSFNQTAERLQVTQSTVSSRVKALEAAMGVRLFKRSRAGTTLTTEGLRFEPHARGLRHSWSTALSATRDVSLGGITMRIGLQHDLVGTGIKTLIEDLRQTFSDTGFFLEADYSAPMCADLVTGAQDVALLYSPQMLPDLTFEPLGEVPYVMVSTHARKMQDVDPKTYIFGNYAPVFAQSHAAQLPALSESYLSIGQNAAMVSLLTGLSGTAYILQASAKELIAQGRCHLVVDAPKIGQPVFAGINGRNRHRRSYRKLVETLAKMF